MRKDEIQLGGTYFATVSGQKRCKVKIEQASSSGGWFARNLETGRQIRIKTAGRLSPIPDKPNRCIVRMLRGKLKPFEVEDLSLATASRRIKALQNLHPDSKVSQVKEGEALVFIIDASTWYDDKEEEHYYCSACQGTGTVCTCI